MPPLIEVRGLSKQFPGVRALDQVDAIFPVGEVVAVVGENGAGKSTLMKIIAGVYTPDAGQILLDGQAVRFATPQAAAQAGISLIHQELNLAENLTVLDNLFLGREKTFGGPLHLLQSRSMAQDGAKLLERVGLSTKDLHRIVGQMAPGQKQLIEIARALGLNARLIIMDEPTSSLTQKETDRLYEVVDALKRDRVTVVYISHRLAEIQRCCDRAIVLRDGQRAGELSRAELTHENLVRLMVGRDLKGYFPRTRAGVGGKPVLQVDQLRYADGPPHAVSFVVRAGEVLGMAGLVGAGRTELSEAVFGLRRCTSGTIKLNGLAVSLRSPAEAVRAGVLLVPEDRRLHGLVLSSNVGFNVSLPNLDSLSQASLVSGSRERELIQEMIARLKIKTPSAEQTVGVLSGGNQQKVVFGKWLARNPRVLILDEPTRGVDVGAKAEIYSLIDQLAASGVAIWMITSDLEELLGMSDRVVVMHEGRLAGELRRDHLTEESVMMLATGSEHS
jgi:ribose transport system ATP-binding protein